MRRAAIPLLAAALAAGCGGEPPQATRSESVRADAGAASAAAERWCDAYFPAGQAPRLALPKVVPARAGASVPALPAGRWVWVNLWATWCGPCRREMPLLETWRQQLTRDGIAVDLWFVSVDEQADTLTSFLAANPAVAPEPSLRLASFRDLGPWLVGLGGAADLTIPVQIVAAPGGAVRCLRAGSLRDGDYPAVRALFER